MKENEKRKIIANRISLARERAGLTQNQLAKLLNIPRPSVAEIESGKRKVSAEELISMSDIFEVDINWLAGKGENKSDEQRDKIQLAARNLSGLKSEDIDKIVDLLNSLKPKGDSH
ncbi:MAG TPA: helix-turn-helix transcriptional regulator [Candidatus Limenecus avicola]|uniref:Helix-turn-helix transcriptional regulator n=1 Tax=Candidatus Limenecus avicola TaxID=2840847 RepID=A0A9D1N0W1_9CLOT|nr:helix-turn-helix transcriptional regulator [Candidatus Limenecus avicola]